MIKQSKSIVVNIWSAMVSQFCVRPTSKRWFLKIIQVTVKHDLFDAMYDFIDLHPFCIHILRWSLKRSMKRTWTSSTFFTNESAWSVLVTGSQSRVCSDPSKSSCTRFVHPMVIFSKPTKWMQTAWWYYGYYFGPMRYWQKPWPWHK